MPPEEHETGLGPGPTNVRFQFDDKRSDIQVDGRSVTVSPKLRDAIKHTASKHAVDGIAAQVDDRFVAIVLYSLLGFGDELFLFDQANGKCKWTAKLWGHTAMELSGVRQGGNVWDHVSILIGNQTVTVFGTEYNQLYAESYEINNGACVFRFSTSLWGSRE